MTSDYSIFDYGGPTDTLTVCFRCGEECQYVNTEIGRVTVPLRKIISDAPPAPTTQM